MTTGITEINAFNFFRFLPAIIGLLSFFYLNVSTGLTAEPPIPVDGGATTSIAVPGPIKGEVLIRFLKGAVPPRSWEKGPGRRIVAGKMFAALTIRRQQIYQHVTSDAFSTAELLEIYRSDPQVEAVSPNYARSPHHLPDDPFFDHLWGLYNTGQSVSGIEGIAGADVDATLAWNISTGDNEVVVAVIDSGVYYDHEDLYPNMWQNPDEVPGNNIDDDGNGYVDDIYGYDFASDNSGNNDSDPMDIETHGSHVTGTAAASGNNGIGITGSVYSCGKGYPAQFPSGVAGNIALIERGSDDENSFYFSDKVQNAMNAGAVAVIIYNNKAGLDDNVTLRSAGNWVPAAFISQTDGQFLASLVTPLATVVISIVSGYLYRDGTSMAAPHVTGAVAVLAAAFPAESVSQRINRILEGTEYLATLAGLVSTGGRLNLNKSLRLYQRVNMAPIYELLLLE